MNYLFLDVDGVLNSMDWFFVRQDMAEYHKARKTWQQMYLDWDDEHNVLHDQWQLDPVSCSVLDEIVQETQCKVVVSSVWRSRRKDVLTEALRRQGFHQPLLAKTRRVESWVDLNQTPRSQVIRGLEIEHWILTHVPFEERADFRFVIIDDESDMGRLHPWLVKTDQAIGLMPDHLKAIQEALSQPVWPLLAEPGPFWVGEAKATLYPTA